MNYIEDFVEPYGSLVFAENVLASAKNMNKLGNQYLSGVYLISHHNHLDNYYTKAEMDLRYFSDTNKTGSNADKVENAHFADLIGSALPKGALIGWENPVIPTGFAIANGQVVAGYTTIDMRDYFIPCAGSSYNVGQTFGSNLFSLAASLSIANHTITIAEMANHAHTFLDYYGSGGSWKRSGGYNTGWLNSNSDTASQNTGSTGGNQGHNHQTGSSIALDQSNYDNRPKFYALYIIEKVVD